MSYDRKANNNSTRRRPSKWNHWPNIKSKILSASTNLFFLHISLFFGSSFRKIKLNLNYDSSILQKIIKMLPQNF